MNRKWKEIPSAWRDLVSPDLLPAAPPSYQPEDTFRALRLLRPEEVRVVLLGMDPYPTPGVPEGLAFSVAPGKKIPPSLRNLLLERESDLGLPLPTSGSLSRWAEEGVLLWNVALSVRPGKAGSHLPLWRDFSEDFLQNFADRPFLLLGRHAQEAASFARFRIEAPHPSPLSAWRGFWGSRPFSRINELLRTLGEDPLSWRLDGDS